MLEAEKEDEEVKGDEWEYRRMFLSNIIEIDKKRPQTIKLKAKINGVLILVLVDSGATHNFIVGKLVKVLGWPVERTEMMSIINEK